MGGICELCSLQDKGKWGDLMESIEIFSFLVIGALIVYLLFHFKVMNDMRAEMRTLHDKMLGSSTKGAVGERLLESIIQPMIDSGFIEKNLEIADRNTFVEFGFKLDENLYLPIDSKWDGQPIKNIEDIKNKYIGAKNTTPFGILSVPDKNFERYEKNLIYAKDRGVFIVRDSLVFPTLGIIKIFHERYSTSKDVEKLYKTIKNWDTYHVDVKKHYESVEQKMGNLKKAIYNK